MSDVATDGTRRKAKPRISRGDWLEAGLEALAREGIAGVRVERLARRLGTSKSGFYWHFRDREELHRALLDHWSEVYTTVVTEDPGLPHLPPRQRLVSAARMILDHDLAHYDTAMRAWADHDPHVAVRVRRVYRERMRFIGAAFEELGFRDEELEMRTKLFVVYHSSERPMFPKEPKSRAHALIERRIALLTRR